MIIKSFMKMAIIVATLILLSLPGFALDTTECFAPGIITDLEGYYGYGWDKDGKAHGVEFVIGGGVADNFSYLFSAGFGKIVPDEGDSISVTGGFGAGLIWTPYEKENLMAIDILPAFTFEPNDVSDDMKSVKPNFTGFSYGVAVELNLMISPMIQPYFAFGYTAYKNTEEIADDEYDDSPAEYPLTIGAMMPASKTIEMLVQLDWTMNEDSNKWAENERSVALGVNILLKDNLELITEIGKSFMIEDEDGNEVSPEGWGIGFGVIYSI